MSPQVLGPLNALSITDAFLLFVVGMIVMQRVEMFIRARRFRPVRATAMSRRLDEE